MSEVKLTAEARTEFGKGAARRLRRAHKVPAVLYGHGTAPVHVALPGHDTMLALKHSNALLSVDLDGTATLALPKDVQRDPLRGFIEHVDLIIVRRGERVIVDVPLHVVGDARPGHAGHQRGHHAVGRGRGHRDPAVDRGGRRGRAGRHPDPRREDRPAGGRDAGRRPGGAASSTSATRPSPPPTRWRPRPPPRRPRRRREAGPRGRPRSGSLTREPSRRAGTIEAWTSSGATDRDAAVAGGRAGQPRSAVRGQPAQRRRHGRRPGGRRPRVALLHPPQPRRGDRGPAAARRPGRPVPGWSWPSRPRT